jgi:hypothetical protein
MNSKELTLLNSISQSGSDNIEQSILRTIAYFSLFNHPLTAIEILDNCDIKEVDPAMLAKGIDRLCTQNTIKRKGTYYYLYDETGIAQRKLSTSLYNQYLKKAYKYSRIISKFPFVRGISISGSIAKGRVDENADIDYFIITAPRRLWICRTLLTLYKKIVLFNSRKYFCINYFVDTDNLQIPDRNIFTATEIAFLLPTYSYSAYSAFISQNAWVNNYYPNKNFKLSKDVRKEETSSIKKIFECVFIGRIGNFLEKFCMELTLAYRRRKFKHLNEAEFRHSLRSTKGVS